MSEHPSQAETFYKSLENINTINIWDIRLNIKYTDHVEGNIEKNVITERKVFNLSYKSGKLISNVQLTDIDGKIDDSLHLEKSEIEYLKNRLLETNNIFLKGRYSNILW